MNLQEVLDANDMNRNSYNTLERRTGLAFMKRDVDPARGRDKYFVAHAVALGCMIDLQEAGVPAGRAASAIDSVFHQITRTVELIAKGQSPGWSMIHIVDFGDDNWGFAFGDPTAKTLQMEAEGAYRSRNSVNVIRTIKRLHARANASETVGA